MDNRNLKSTDGIFITAGHLAEAPPEVRRWLLASFGTEAVPDATDFILEQNGFRSSGNGLAICSRREIIGLLRDLGEDDLACQVLFQLGCDFYNAATGQRRPHPLTLQDFLYHTDVPDSRTLFERLDRINHMLRQRRGDANAAIYRRDGHGGIEVHEETQHAIYQLWRRLVRRIDARLHHRQR